MIPSRARRGETLAQALQRRWPVLVLRLGALALFVYIGDRVMVEMGHRGWTLPMEAVVVLRLLSSLAVLVAPFEGFVVALEVDKWDWFWLDAGDRSAEFQALYQEWDKVLDLALLAVAAVAAWRWRDPVARALALGAFALRVVGVAAFIATEQRWLLMAFPNVFETLYLLYAGFRLLAARDRMLTSARVTLLVVVVTLTPKLIEEYFLHVLEQRPWDWVQLPMPHAMEPRAWVAITYLPLLLTGLALAWRSRNQPAQ
ncbi:MAG: hypothetical protein FJ035_00595 [Chloroflexi bacterium]|nr:hypothetical protein [Chloroflexota bacterium]